MKNRCHLYYLELFVSLLCSPPLPFDTFSLSGITRLFLAHFFDLFSSTLESISKLAASL